MKAIPTYLEHLARFVPALTQAQLTRHYFAGDALAMMGALKSAQAQGLIEATVELIRPRRTEEPIAVVRVGEGSPSAERVAYAAARRWSGTVGPTLVVKATSELAALAGGETRLIATGHMSHEVALADVFLQKRIEDPSFGWTLVGATPVAGGRVDAIAGNVMIELVGRYSGAAVAVKMQVAGSMTLELW